MKRILFVAGEGLPYVKSGGLADVVGSLPQALVKLGYRVNVALPLYKSIVDKHLPRFKLVGSFELDVASMHYPVRVFSEKRGEITYFFIEHQGFFERDSLYGQGDDGERFAFFQHAVLRMMYEFKDFYDILHVHDWHTGMIPILGKTIYSSLSPKFAKIKYVYTIHNLAFQGNFSADLLGTHLGLPYYLFENGELQFYNGISFMKAGIVFAEKVTTVSNTYAHEILTEAYGENMQHVLRLREHDLWGIVNGIDLEEHNPATDPLIPYSFDLDDLSGKAKNKMALQEQLGLRVAPDVCLVGMVSRLSWQKGVNLIIDKMRDIMGLDIQLVILGTGEAQYEYDLHQSELAYRRRMVFYGGYSNEIAHKIYAGADLFLMPSLFEPCGLSQLISMRYGTLPIVRETGGLVDTVAAYNEYEKTGTGFSFTHFNTDEFYHVLRMAVELYYLNQKDFKLLQTNAMKVDSSWDASAVTYQRLYDSLF